jgi:hypothetical protein
MESTATHWKSLRNGVVVSVVMLYLIEPAMKVAVDIAPQFGGRFYRLVWDRAAMQAAIGGDYLTSRCSRSYSCHRGCIHRALRGGRRFAALRRRAAETRFDARPLGKALSCCSCCHGPIAATTLWSTARGKCGFAAASPYSRRHHRESEELPLAVPPEAAPITKSGGEMIDSRCKRA